MLFKMNLIIRILTILQVIVTFIYCSANEYFPVSSTDSFIGSSTKHKSVAPCVACRYLVQSFLKALEETTRLSFEGGDADWEREKLGNYENSELRFIEVQEKLCSDLTSGKDQCFNLAELYESDLESWFFEKRDDDLFKSFCIDHLKVCCPNNTYGPNCIPCPGGIENPCSGHGKCKNGGTRNKSAACICDAGYTGKLCNKCAKGYYKDLTKTQHFCEICDIACKDHCRGPGPNNCEVCSEGYNFIPNKGCLSPDDTLSPGNISNESDDLNLHLKPELLDTDHDEL